MVPVPLGRPLTASGSFVGEEVPELDAGEALHVQLCLVLAHLPLFLLTQRMSIHSLGFLLFDLKL